MRDGLKNKEDLTPPGKKDLSVLQQIPGVGQSIARDLWRLGIRSLFQLRDQDPEELYARLCALQGRPLDRCLLYVFRCAVYY
ncbi:MAG: pathogenicity locus, partial [Deltaproteobacteria bacterium]|nr:pathogenicity locus [Deltaproteobacteria bacterium]